MHHRCDEHLDSERKLCSGLAVTCKGWGWYSIWAAGYEQCIWTGRLVERSCGIALSHVARVVQARSRCIWVWQRFARLCMLNVKGK
jgi:hypothetical protein